MAPHLPPKRKAGSCCGPASPTPDVRSAVRDRYGAVAEGRTGAAGCCSGPTDAAGVLERIGYTADQAAAIPEGANLGLGCGNPVGLADLGPGEVVLDLGSGAGVDCFLAAKAVGPSGRAIGVDMTPAMVERARALAEGSGIPNVEFRLGEIEHLPAADASVDVVVSNCVVNLAPDKTAVFREAFRVLRPGGRMVVSDLVLRRPISDEVRNDVEAYVGCIAGAALREDYLAAIRAAGFVDVEVLAESGYDVGRDACDAGSPRDDAYDAVSSVKVRARRPR